MKSKHLNNLFRIATLRSTIGLSKGAVLAYVRASHPKDEPFWEHLAVLETVAQEGKFRVSCYVVAFVDCLCCFYLFLLPFVAFDSLCIRLRRATSFYKRA